MKELKDLLEPPFTALFSISGDLCMYDADDYCAIIGEILPAGFFEQKITKEQRKEFAQLLAAALNSEWQRQFGGERWCKYKTAAGYTRYKCLVCGSANYTSSFKYCPWCGIKLLPPEGEK